MNEPSRDPMSEAVEHFARLRGGQRAPQDLDALKGWLDAHPANRAAFDEVSDHWSDIGVLREDPVMMGMRAAARRDLQRQQVRRLALGSLAACLAVLVAVGAVLSPRAYNHFAYVLARDHAPTFSTPIGQLAKITLPDGTLATLDTDTVLRAWQLRHGRYVELVKGRARFQVTKDPNKPFSVLAAGKSVTALGTDFSVYLRPDAMYVTLVEGRLRVKGEGGGPNIPAIDMSAGYRLTTNGRDWGLARTDALSDVSWTDRQLHFDESTLQEIADELNRYSVNKIVIPDPRIGSLRMSAVISSTDRQSFLDAVNALSLARVRRVGDTYELVSRQRTAG
jgi:transmembrane sensor